MTAEKIKQDLQRLADPERAKNLRWFFKTGKGEYAEGDKFIGLRVPQIRSVAKKYSNISLAELKKLMQSPVHEIRFAAIVILTAQFKKGNDDEKKDIVAFYLENLEYVNNWDLVDMSAYKILGQHLLERDRAILYKFAKSKDLWERRISIMTTLAFINKDDFDDTLKLSEILLHDEHDLIHKAVGWMLREIGNRNVDVEKKFLDKYSKEMPRTMLRYAIEKFPESQRQHYLKR